VEKKCGGSVNRSSKHLPASRPSTIGRTLAFVTPINKTVEGRCARMIVSIRIPAMHKPNPAPAATGLLSQKIPSPAPGKVHGLPGVDDLAVLVGTSARLHQFGRYLGPWPRAPAGPGSCGIAGMPRTGGAFEDRPFDNQRAVDGRHFVGWF